MYGNSVQVGVLAFNTAGTLLASGGLDGAHTMPSNLEECHRQHPEYLVLPLRQCNVIIAASERHRFTLCCAGRESGNMGRSHRAVQAHAGRPRRSHRVGTVASQG